MLQGHRLHCLTILGRPSCGLTPRKVAVFPAVRSEAIGTSRHPTAPQQFSRFWAEADIGPGFMSTRPNRIFLPRES
jgi:hypothetical protein